MKLPSLGGEFMEADRRMDRQTARPDETTRFSQNCERVFKYYIIIEGRKCVVEKQSFFRAAKLRIPGLLECYTVLRVD